LNYRVKSGTNVDIRNTSGAISETVVVGTRKETVGYRRRSGVSTRGSCRGSSEGDYPPLDR